MEGHGEFLITLVKIFSSGNDFVASDYDIFTLIFSPLQFFSQQLIHFTLAKGKAGVDIDIFVGSSISQLFRIGEY